MGKVNVVNDPSYADYANDKQGALDQIRTSGSASPFTAISPIKAASAWIKGNERPLDGNVNPYSQMSSVYDQLAEINKKQYEAEQSGQKYQMSPEGQALTELWKSYRRGVVPSP